MDFSPQQSKAIDAVGAWLKDAGAKQTFYLAGYAGTGKTTLAKHLAEQSAGEYKFLAFTGKAASVLRKKGNKADTIHSAIYRLLPQDVEKISKNRNLFKMAQNEEEKDRLGQEFRELTKPKFELNQASEVQDLDLIIVDEVSMVGDEMANDLLSFGKKVLVLGDPGQLPPVGGEGYFTKGEPDFLLEEIHRQAENSPIIKMATLVRKGFRLGRGAYGSSKVIDRNNIDSSILINTDQTIVGMNRTRHALNSRIRDLLSFGPGSVPELGEKLICLRNNKELGLLNGTQWRVLNVEDKGTWISLELIDWDDSSSKLIEVDAHPFDADIKNMSPWQRRNFDEFDFGYAITCHKSQGSQWDNVFVQNESYVFKDDAKKWLYTAITRAAETVTIAT